VRGIEEISDSKGERYAVKQLEKTKANLEVKLERLSESPVRDNVVIFEELGVDRLFVDESHEFKNV
jgi:N12 class adenine-specific DNA methylase